MKNKYVVTFRNSLMFCMILCCLLVSVGCSKKDEVGASANSRGKKEMMFPVETSIVKSEPVTYSIFSVGSVEAFEVVQITARVAGVVDKVLFSEGSNVQANQVLAEIETQRYRLAVESAKAAFEKAKAAKADAEAGLNRRKGVSEKNPGLIPGEELETWQTKVRTANSEVALTQAQLNQAELNLHDAQVRSPVAGITQTRSIQTGQYVQPGSVLATMIRRDPLLLRFKVTEQDASQLKPGLKAFFQVKNDKTEYTSVITYVSASADTNTRMASVTAEITDSHKSMLQAGAFAEVHVPVGNSTNSPVIPQSAVRPSEKGFLAFVVENGKAVERTLTLGMRTSEGLVQVIDGLKSGEVLVVRGAEALRSGVSVKESVLEKSELNRAIK